uniref:Uncharacterized protein n=1 Tax=viral metagenome TaxID=1070528 RepID=A0A6C0JM32_9ZZZZ
MASNIKQIKHNVYIPDWDSETEKYINICHFEPNKSGESYICNCRNKDTDIFNTKSKYDAHIKNKQHQRWVAAYGKQATEENKSLKEENTTKDKEIAILNRKLEKQIARSERYKLERDKYIRMLNQEEDQDAFECD